MLILWYQAIPWPTQGWDRCQEGSVVSLPVSWSKILQQRRLVLLKQSELVPRPGACHLPLKVVLPWTCRLQERAEPCEEHSQVVALPHEHLLACSLRVSQRWCQLAPALLVCKRGRQELGQSWSSCSGPSLKLKPLRFSRVVSWSGSSYSFQLLERILLRQQQTF